MIQIIEPPEEIIKKPVIVFTIADKNNFKYAVTMLKTLRKFHDWPVLIYTDEVKEDELAKQYQDWEILEKRAYRFIHTHPDGPTHEHAGNEIIAKKT